MAFSFSKFERRKPQMPAKPYLFTLVLEYNPAESGVIIKCNLDL
jgi:hypothetical protein